MRPVVTLLPDRDKAVEALLYIVQDIHDVYRAFKTLYLANREHLHRYGRPICDESFVAMDHGPVPSYLYDVIKRARGDSSFSVAPHHIDVFKVRGKTRISGRREPDMHRLSQSEVECLNAAIAEHKNRTFGELRRMTHTKEFERYRQEHPNERMPLDVIVRGLPNEEELLALVMDD
jgi:uncharacterized phage-associated protein